MSERIIGLDDCVDHLVLCPKWPNHGMLEFISSGLAHRGPSPPSHALIEGNPLISGPLAPPPAPICWAHEQKFAAARVTTPKYKV
jgi:hypothetical protein